MLKLLPFILVMLLGLFIVALRYLPWWGILLVFAGIYLFFKFALKHLVVRLFMIPFKAKGAVLKGATAEVHSVTWEPAPVKPPREEKAPAHAAIEYDGPDAAASEESNGAGGHAMPKGEGDDDDDDEDEDEYAEHYSGGDDDDEDEDEDKSPRDYYRIEVTITPQPKSGGFQHWEPGELLLMPHDAKVAPLSSDENEMGYGTREIEVFEDGKYAPDEACKYFGPQRLRILAGVPLDAPRRLKFRYYFEAFGDFTLPPSLVSST